MSTFTITGPVTVSLSADQGATWTSLVSSEMALEYADPWEALVPAMPCRLRVRVASITSEAKDEQ